MPHSGLPSIQHRLDFINLNHSWENSQAVWVGLRNTDEPPQEHSSPKIYNCKRGKNEKQLLLERNLTGTRQTDVKQSKALPNSK